MRSKFRWWRDQFRIRARREHPVPDETEIYLLSDDEIQELGRSMANFSLGESSDGSNLKMKASRWGRRHGAPELAEVVTLFINEENRHSRLLSDILKANDIASIQSNWTDRVFRFVRRLQGLWLMTTVLVTAETIALTYYQALSRATKNTWLQKVCEQIFEDEEVHLAYELDLLRAIEADHTSLRRQVNRLIHSAIYLPACLVVFLEHERVFRRAKMGVLEYFASCVQDLCAFHQAILRPEDDARASGATPTCEKPIVAQ